MRLQCEVVLRARQGISIRTISVLETKRQQKIQEARIYKKSQVQKIELNEAEQDIRRQLMQLSQNNINGLEFGKIKSYLSREDQIKYCNLKLVMRTLGSQDLRVIETIACELDVPCVDLLNNLFNRYSNLQDRKSMERMLKFMIDAKLDAQHCVGCLLKHYSRDGPIESALRLVEYAKLNDLFKPEYNASLIDTFSVSRRPWEVMKVLGDMESSGSLIDSQILRQSLSAFAKNGEIQGMNNILKIMDGKQFVRSTSIYNILITGYKNAGNYAKILLLYAEMKNSLSCQPDKFTLSMLIDMYGKQSNAEAASHILLDMIDSNIPLNRVYFNSIMDAFAKAKNPKKVLEYYQMMQNYGMVIGEDTLTILLSMYGTEKNISKIEEVIKQMSELRIQPSKFTIGTIIRVYFENDDYATSKLWFEKLKERGMFPNSPILITMIRISLLENQTLGQTLYYFEIGDKLGVVNLPICHEYVKAMLIHGMGIDEVIPKFLDQVKEKKLKLTNKSIFLFLDSILRPLSLRSHLRNHTVRQSDSTINTTNGIRKGKLEFQELVQIFKTDVSFISNTIQTEIEQSLKLLE